MEELFCTDVCVKVFLCKDQLFKSRVSIYTPSQALLVWGEAMAGQCEAWAEAWWVDAPAPLLYRMMLSTPTYCGGLLAERRAGFICWNSQKEALSDMWGWGAQLNYDRQRHIQTPVRKFPRGDQPLPTEPAVQLLTS